MTARPRRPTMTLGGPNRLVLAAATGGLVTLASAGTALLVLTGTAAVGPATTLVPPLPNQQPLAKAPGVVVLPSGQAALLGGSLSHRPVHQRGHSLAAISPVRVPLPLSVFRPQPVPQPVSQAAPVALPFGAPVTAPVTAPGPVAVAGSVAGPVAGPVLAPVASPVLAGSADFAALLRAGLVAEPAPSTADRKARQAGEKAARRGGAGGAGGAGDEDVLVAPPFRSSLGAALLRSGVDDAEQDGGSAAPAAPHRGKAGAHVKHLKHLKHAKHAKHAKKAHRSAPHSHQRQPRGHHR